MTRGLVHRILILLGCLSGSFMPAACTPTLESVGSTGAAESTSGSGGLDPQPTPVPTTSLISSALDCGQAKLVGGISAGDQPLDLERYTVDTTVYPSAVCNDGSPAIFYFRPAVNAANDNKWVIQLQGGGGCTTPEACAKRWCNVDTNFSMTQMTSNTSPEKTPPVGIFARKSDDPKLPAENPIGDSNQVMIKYCSSDTWRGTASDVAISAPHPLTGVDTQMRLHFQGQGIFQAVLSLLRRSQGAVIKHTGTGKGMPDLDDAQEVILAGASAGGGGVTFNLDALTASLRVVNPAVTVLGLIDSTFGPEGYDLDYSASTQCVSIGICSPEDSGNYGLGVQRDFWKAIPEGSCESHHATDGALWKCAFDTHVVLNHLTTPFFVRQGLTDSVVSEGLVDTGVLINGRDYVLSDFTDQVRNHLTQDLPNLLSQAEEHASMTLAPGAFAPLCSKHETLRSTFDTHFVTIKKGLFPLDMFDAWKNWRSGLPNSIVVHTEPKSVSQCK